MNDTQLSALIGLAGSMVGALAALAGTWLTLWHTRRESRSQRDDERREARFRELRDAYIEWVAAFEVVEYRLSSLQSIRADPSSGEKGEYIKLYEGIRTDTILHASKLMLIDSNTESLNRINATIAAFHIVLDEIIAGPEGKIGLKTAWTNLKVIENDLRAHLCERFSGLKLTTGRKPSAPSPPG